MSRDLIRNVLLECERYLAETHDDLPPREMALHRRIIAALNELESGVIPVERPEVPRPQ
jgi:hypothetical protein